MTLQVYLAITIAVTGSALGFVAFAVAWVVRPRSQEEKIRGHERAFAGAAPDSVT